MKLGKERSKKSLLKLIVLGLLLSNSTTFSILNEKQEEKEENNIFSFISWNFFSKKGMNLKKTTKELTIPEPPVEPPVEPPIEPPIGNTYILNENTGKDFYELKQSIEVNNNTKQLKALVGLAADTSVAEVINSTGNLIKTIGENTIGIGAYSGAKATNNGVVDVNGNSSIGMHSKDNSSIINNGEVNLNNGGIGVLTNNSKATNSSTGKITVIGNAIGMNGINNSSMVNSGSIEVEEGIGVKVENSAINNQGIINLNGENSIGIVGENNSTINMTNGKILSTQNAVIGIQSSNSKVVLDENSLIQLTGENSKGILATDLSIIENNGTVTIAGSSSVGIHAINNSTTTNNGEVKINAGTGILADNSSITNSSTGKITVTGKAIGMNGINSAKLINDGTITVGNVSAEGTGIKIDNSNVNNQGTINLNRWNSVGIVGENNSTINMTNGKIMSTQNAVVGIQSSNSKVVLDENSLIQLVGNNNKAIMATNMSTIENNGQIKIAGENAKGISQYSNDTGKGVYINNGSIILEGKNALGIASNNDSTVENSGLIKTTGNNSSGIAAYNSKTSNIGTIEVNGKGAVGYSMAAGNLNNEETGKIVAINSDGSRGVNLNSIYTNEWTYVNYTGTVNNKGIIEVDGGIVKNLVYDPDGKGPIIGPNGDTFSEVEKGVSGINVIKGIVNNDNTIKATGIKATGINSSSSNVLNKGNITVEGDNSIGITGNIVTAISKPTGNMVTTPDGNEIEIYENIKLSDNAIFSNFIQNDSEVSVVGVNAIGVSLNGAVQNIGGKTVFNKFTNKGTINVNGSGNIYGIKATNTIITNEGTISVENTEVTGNAFGIDVNNSYVVNSSTGIINVTGSTAVGINATNKTHVNNEGEINLSTSGTGNAVGIKVDGTSTFVNTGIIKVDGVDKNIPGNSIDQTEEEYLNANNGVYNPIKLSKGAVFSNKGVLDYGSNVFDTSELGAGKFIIEDKSKLNAKEVSGDIYVDSKETLGKMENNYTYESAIETDKYNANLISDSYIFEAIAKEEDNNIYNIELNRKNLETITINKSFGEYLEKNYNNSNINSFGIEIFDAIKLNSRTEEEYNKFMEQLSGENFYSNILPQTLDIYNNNRKLNLNSLKDLNFDLTEEYIVGYNFTRQTKESTDTQLGYNDNVNNVVLGLSKKIKPTLNVGYIFNYSNLESDYQGSSKREENLFEFGGFINKRFNKDIEYIGMLSFGYGDGNIKREVELANKNLKSDVKNKYLGITNQIIKNYTYNQFKVSPSLSLNFDSIKQYGIDEGNNLYALSLDDKTLNLLKMGAGLKLGYEAALKNSILGFELGGNVYRNIHSSDNYKASLKYLDGKYEMNAYEVDKISSDIFTTVKLLQDNKEYYISYEQEFNKQNSWKASIGFIYKFNNFKDIVEDTFVFEKTSFNYENNVYLLNDSQKEKLYSLSQKLNATNENKQIKINK